MNANRFLNTLMLVLAVGLWSAGPLVGPGWAQKDDHAAETPEQQRKSDGEEHAKEEQDEHQGEESGEHAEEDDDEHAEEGLVHLDAAELKEFGVEIATAGAGRLGLTLKVPGKVVMPTDRIAHVVPRVPGYAREIRVGLGDRVKEGQVMAVLDSPALGEAKDVYLTALQERQLADNDRERATVVRGSVGELLVLLAQSPDLAALEALNGSQAGVYRSQLVSTYSELSFAGETYRREKALYEKKIASGEEFLAAENEFKKARAEYAAMRDQVAFDVKTTLLQAERSAKVAELALRSAERRLHVFGIDEAAVAELAAGKEPEEQLARYAIRAPFSGVVIEQHITPGEVLGDTSDAYVVADLGSVWVDLSVFPKNINQVRKGMAAIVSTGDGPATQGKVTYVSPVVDEETRSGLARVALPNPEGAWKPGMFVNGELVLSEVEVPVLVPQTALQSLEGRAVVFVREGDGFEARPVVVGRSNELHAELTDGLHAGDEYVSAGAFALKAHLGKSNLDDGHNH